MADEIADRDGYLAVGYTVADEVTTGRLWRSRDGASWEPLAAGAFPNTELTHITRLGEGYAIVGSRRAPSSGATEPLGLTVWWSADLTSWRDVTPERALGFVVGLVAAGPEGLLISVGPSRDVGRDFYLAIDPDLQAELFEVARATDVRMLGLAAGDSGWIAVGATGIQSPTTSPTCSLGAVWTSRDGASWSLASVDDPGGAIQSVERVASGYVATGSDVSLPCAECLGGLVRQQDLATWVSDDGTNWRRGTTFASGPGVRFGDGVWPGGSRVAGDGARALLFDSNPDYQPVTQESLDGQRWHEIRNAYDADAADVELVSGFDGPVIIGPDRVVAFRYAMSDGSGGTRRSRLSRQQGLGPGRRRSRRTRCRPRTTRPARTSNRADRDGSARGPTLRACWTTSPSGRATAAS